MTAQHFDPIKRPGLAYQHAFDWLAVRMVSRGPSACQTSSEFCSVELLRRLPDMPFLSPVPDRLEPALTSLGLWMPEIIDPSVVNLKAVVWLEPTVEDGDMLEKIIQAMSPSGKLYLLVGGPLARFLEERRTGENGQASYLNDRVAIRALRQYGFQITERLGWHGFQAIGFHTMGQVAMVLNQRQRQDRFHYAMRRAFGEQGRGRHLTALTCLAAERVM